MVDTAKDCFELEFQIVRLRRLTVRQPRGVRNIVIRSASVSKLLHTGSTAFYIIDM